jgi:hypothetical protein
MQQQYQLMKTNFPNIIVAITAQDQNRQVHVGAGFYFEVADEALAVAVTAAPPRASLFSPVQLISPI